jgi:hypothetical protein
MAIDLEPKMVNIPLSLTPGFVATWMTKSSKVVAMKKRNRCLAVGTYGVFRDPMW